MSEPITAQRTRRAASAAAGTGRVPAPESAPAQAAIQPAPSGRSRTPQLAATRPRSRAMASITAMCRGPIRLRKVSRSGRGSAPAGSSGAPDGQSGPPSSSAGTSTRPLPSAKPPCTTVGTGRRSGR